MNRHQADNPANAANHASLPRRRFLQLSGALAVTGAPALKANADPIAETSARPPIPDALPKGYNILFVLTDQERYSDTWPFPLPGRELLKRRGVSFTNHQIASCICSPSRSTIYTGRHIQHTGMFDNAGVPWQPDMSTEVPTAGHMMQAAGYHAAYLGKWHLSKSMHLTHTEYDAPVAQYNQKMKEYGFDDFFGVGDLIGLAHGGYLYDGMTTDSAIAWMRKRHADPALADKRWFLALNLVNPHDAMYVNTDAPGVAVQTRNKPVLNIKRPPADTMYAKGWRAAPLPLSRRQALDAPGRPAAHRMYSMAHGKLVGEFPFSDERVSLYQDNYFNCIRDSDTHLLRLLEALSAMGLDQNTIVVMTSDHGDHAGYHQLVDKGATAYRQQNHVPLIISHPAYTGGKTCRALTSHIDVLPTLLGLTGSGPAKAKLPGHDFSHLLADPEAAAIDAVRQGTLFNYAMLSYADSNWMASVQRTNRNKDLSPVEKGARLAHMQPDLRFRGAIRSVFDGRYRFTRYFSLDQFNRPADLKELFAANDVELFDLSADPEEMKNLAMQAGKYGELIMAMNAKLNMLVDQEVGVDSAACMPIHDGRVDYQFGRPA